MQKVLFDFANSGLPSYIKRPEKTKCSLWPYCEICPSNNKDQDDDSDNESDDQQSNSRNNNS